MAKKKTKALSYIKYGALAFAVLGLVFTLLTFVQKEVIGTTTAYTGLQVIFGYSEGSIVAVKVLNFSFMALLAVILPLIGSCTIFFKNRLARLIGTVLMLAGTVLCFLVPNFVVFAQELVDIKLGLGIGAILSAISFLLGTACCAYSVVEK